MIRSYEEILGTLLAVSGISNVCQPVQIDLTGIMINIVVWEEDDVRGNVLRNLPRLQ